MGSLSSSPWNTWAMPKSCMRRLTAAESRPEITATSTPLLQQAFHALAVVHMEDLEFLAAGAVVEPAVGEHAVHVEYHERTRAARFL